MEYPDTEVLLWRLQIGGSMDKQLEKFMAFSGGILNSEEHKLKMKRKFGQNARGGFLIVERHCI